MAEKPKAKPKTHKVRTPHAELSVPEKADAKTPAERLAEQKREGS